MKPLTALGGATIGGGLAFLGSLVGSYLALVPGRKTPLTENEQMEIFMAAAAAALGGAAAGAILGGSAAKALSAPCATAPTTTGTGRPQIPQLV